jgi:hypothetical protein
MAWTNFVITAAAIAAVASLMRSDIRQTTSMLRKNVSQVRKMIEDVSGGQKVSDVIKKAEEDFMQSKGKK